MPKLSIVIPCFNHGQFIKAAVESVETCPSELYELIIVDDGSTEEATASVMSDLKNLGYRVITQDNQGLPAARNAGIAASGGKYVLPLDSDNKIRAAFVEKAVRVLDDRPEVAIVHSDFQYAGLLDHLARISPFDLKTMLYSNRIDACAVYRKEVWTACGGYDSQMVDGLEDWEFWLNAYSRGFHFLHLDMVGFDYTARKDSMLDRAKSEQTWRKLVAYIVKKHPMMFKDEYNDYYRWDYHGRELRRRPLRTLFRLFANAFFPKVHDRIYRLD